jgi:error-prone DNA polymerase
LVSTVSGIARRHFCSVSLCIGLVERYFQAAFTASILNSLPMGFYAPAQLVADARRHGVTVLPPDVNFSEWDCTLEPIESVSPHPGLGPTIPKPEASAREVALTLADASDYDLPTGHFVSSAHLGPRPHKVPGIPDQESRRQCNSMRGSRDDRFPWLALRLGLRQIDGLPREAADRLIAARQQGGPFSSVSEFAARTGLGPGVMARLSTADALASLTSHRRAALWQARSREIMRRRPLLDHETYDDEAAELLSPLDLQHEVFADYQSVGLSLRAHPLSFHRPQLDAWRILPRRRCRYPEIASGAWRG